MEDVSRASDDHTSLSFDPPANHRTNICKNNILDKNQNSTGLTSNSWGCMILNNSNQNGKLSF